VRAGKLCPLIGIVSVVVVKWKEHFLGISPFIRLSKGQMVPLTSLVVPCWQTKKTNKKQKQQKI
jgi:hypothetical protein